MCAVEKSLFKPFRLALFFSSFISFFFFLVYPVPLILSHSFSSVYIDIQTLFEETIAHDIEKCPFLKKKQKKLII